MGPIWSEDETFAMVSLQRTPLLAAAEAGHAEVENSDVPGSLRDLVLFVGPGKVLVLPHVRAHASQLLQALENLRYPVTAWTIAAVGSLNSQPT